MTTLQFQADTDNIEPHHLQGFFVGWPSHPTPETHLRLLNNSDAIAIAFDTDVERVVGFANAISDGILSAYIPLLEVLPDWQGQGIGTQLIESLRDQLDHLYMVDLLCDPDLEAFYRPLGFQQTTGMMIRNYDNQSGNRENG